MGAIRIGKSGTRTGRRAKTELPANVILHDDRNEINRVVW